MVFELKDLSAVMKISSFHCLQPYYQTVEILYVGDMQIIVIALSCAF